MRCKYALTLKLRLQIGPQRVLYCTFVHTNNFVVVQREGQNKPWNQLFGLVLLFSHIYIKKQIPSHGRDLS